MVESRSFVRDEALRWLGEAKWGYETALILRRERRYSAAAFYAHQPAEKTAKALPYHVNEAPWDCSVRVFLERRLAKTGADADPELLSSSLRILLRSQWLEGVLPSSFRMRVFEA